MKLFLIVISNANNDYITSVLSVCENEIEVRKKSNLILNKGEFIDSVDEVNEINGFKIFIEK